MAYSSLLKLCKTPLYLYELCVKELFLFVKFVLIRVNSCKESTGECYSPHLMAPLSYRSDELKGECSPNLNLSLLFVGDQSSSALGKGLRVKRVGSRYSMSNSRHSSYNLTCNFLLFKQYAIMKVSHLPADLNKSHTICLKPFS